MSPPFRIWCVPLPTDLYRTVAHQLNTSPELLRLFFVSSSHRNNNNDSPQSNDDTADAKKAVVEIVSDRDLAQCIAEYGTTMGLGGTAPAAGGIGTDARSAIPLVAVVDDGGALGRLCLSLGSAALYVGQWVTERVDQWWRDPRRLPFRKWIGNAVPGLGAGPRTAEEAPLSSTTLVIVGVVGAGMVVALSGLALLALDGMLDRVRSRAPRVSYKPTRQMVALGHRNRSPTAIFLPPPPAMRGPQMPMAPPYTSSAGR